jgi:hypothetical protein
MVRVSLVSLPLLGILLSSSTAMAVEWWHDPDRGCGIVENWKKSKRIGDLPGCDGELPKGAPPGEVAMHDAKKLLREAEKQVDAGQTGEVETRIGQATDIMNKAPNDPRVNWARLQFNDAFKVLKSKAALSSKVAKLRSAVKAVADQTGAAKPDGKAIAEAATACVQAFKDAETAGVDLLVPYELTKDKLRPLRDEMNDCETAKTRANDVASKPPETGTPTATGTPDKPTTAAKPAGGGSDGGVPRDKWVKKLKGDRKKVFDEHENAFPEFDGEAGPKGASKAPEWKYGAEVFKFKGNKLVKDKGEAKDKDKGKAKEG